jgi:transcription initiation factor IIE alpha subunit
VTRAPRPDRNRHFGPKPGGRSDQVVELLKARGWAATDEIAAALGVRPAALGNVIALLAEEGTVVRDTPRGPWRLAAGDQEKRAC